MKHLIFLLAALLLAAVPALSEDHAILEFRSLITVNGNATLHVAETITYRTAQGNGTEGPVRSFPASHATPDGGRIDSRPKVLALTLDGTMLPHETTQGTDEYLLPLYEAGTVPSPGDHSCVIEYLVDGQVLLGKDADALAWPVTGFAWDVPVASAQAFVSIPGNPIVADMRGWTGIPGETGTDLEFGFTDKGLPWFRTTRELPPGTGLSLFVAWPKGLVEESGGFLGSWNWTSPLALGISGLLALAIVFAAVVLRKRR